MVQLRQAAPGLLVVKQPNVTHNVTTCMGHEWQMRTLLKGIQSPC